MSCRSEPASSADKDGCFELTWYRDVDGDGAGDVQGPFASCDAPNGHVANFDDCDDQDPSVFPGAPELCDGLDNDCNGLVDDALEGGTTIWYADADGDGFGDPAASDESCVELSGYVQNGDDCDDGNPGVSPDAVDTPRDGIDSDCDGADAESLSERAHVGDLSLLDNAAVAEFCATYDAVVGDLQLAGPGLSGELDLDCLVEVTGELLVSTDSVTALSLPSLWWVGSELRLAGNPALVDLSVPDLRFVDGPLVLIDNDQLDAPVFDALEATGGLPRVDSGEFPVLTAVVGDVALSEGLSINALAEVSGSLTIRDGSLVAVSLPSLETVGAVDLRSVQVSAVQLDSLVEAASLDFELPGVDGELSLPSLETVSGDLRIEQGVSQLSMSALESVGGLLSLEQAGLEAVQLESLQSVGDDLRVGGADLATASMGGLQTVGGDLVWTCPDCTEMQLPELVSTGGELSLTGGPETADLSVASLERTGGALALVDLAKVRDIGLGELTTVGGPIAISELPWVETVDLASLVDPPEAVEVRSLPALESLSLDALRLGEVRGELVVLDNANLTTLTLGSLAAEAGSIRIQGNGALTSVELSTLSQVGQLQVSGSFAELDLSQLALTTGGVELSLDSASSLRMDVLGQVGGDLVLTGPLATVELGQLAVVGGTLSLNASDATSLDLGSLTEVFSDFTVQLNGTETLDLTSLESVGGTATFQNGTALESISMPALDSIGTLSIQGLTELTSLSAPVLESTSSDVNIVENSSIVDLSGLSSLQTIGGSLAIISNVSLADVSGLGGITAIGADLRIQDNIALSTEDAESLAYDDIGSASVGGGVTITGNAP